MRLMYSCTLAGGVARLSQPVALLECYLLLPLLLNRAWLLLSLATARPAEYARLALFLKSTRNSKCHVQGPCIWHVQGIWMACTRLAHGTPWWWWSKGTLTLCMQCKYALLGLECIQSNKARQTSVPTQHEMHQFEHRQSTVLEPEPAHS